MIKEIKYNEVWYDRWLPLAQTLLPGTGGASEFEYIRQVLIYQDGDYRKGAVIFSVLIPNP